ncbi:MAG TPA: DUF4105 domain-containing protein [Candidatus Paceibacterota bacterium]
MKLFLKWSKKIILYPFILIIFILAIVFTITNLLTKPSNDRDWNEDQQILPYSEIKDNKVAIHNIRNFTYASTTSFVKNYYDKTFDLDKIKNVWYVVEPFSGIPGSAHAFLSFEFEGDEFLSISIEIRKQKGQAYHPIKGLFNQYELMYVIADEKDVIKLRSNYRKDLVYVYPAKTTKEKVQKLFLSMIERANRLKENPEFYNTVLNTCTTNIAKHVNSISPKRIPVFSLEILFPENSDKLAYDLGLIDTNLPFEKARERYFINDRALKYADSPDFSLKIREND